MRKIYRKLTSIYFRTNILVFVGMIPVYHILKIPALELYCGFAFLLLLTIFLFRNKISELVSLFVLLTNLDLFALYFTLVTGAGAGVELYPLTLTGLCYLLTFDLKKPKWLCPVFAVFSTLICLYITIVSKVFLPEKYIYGLEFYKAHYIFTTIIIICSFVMLSIAYERMLKAKNKKEADQREELMHIANHDPLTGLCNRRKIWEFLYLCENEKNTRDKNFVICIFDIDYFKRVNDTYGHDCGDFILVQISDLVRKNLPEDVKIGRWGGEEFLLLFSDYIDEDAINEIEKIRKLVDEARFNYCGTEIHITLTFGVSSSTYCDTAEHIIVDADKQLMKGKIQGKNRVVARNIQKGLSENDAIFDSFIDSSHKD